MRYCPLSLGVGQSLILPSVHLLTLCISLRNLVLFWLSSLRNIYMTVSDSTASFIGFCWGFFFAYLARFSLLHWLNLSQALSQASGYIQLSLKRNGYELQFHSLRAWSLLIIDAIALLIIRSSIKLSLHLHLCLVGCSRIWSLNDSSQTKIWYHRPNIYANTSLFNTVTNWTSNISTAHLLDNFQPL